MGLSGSRVNLDGVLKFDTGLTVLTGLEVRLAFFEMLLLCDFGVANNPRERSH